MFWIQRGLRRPGLMLRAMVTFHLPRARLTLALPAGLAWRVCRTWEDRFRPGSKAFLLGECRLWAWANLVPGEVD